MCVDVGVYKYILCVSVCCFEYDERVILRTFFVYLLFINLSVHGQKELDSESEIV